jgi:hypothetical protein
MPFQLVFPRHELTDPWSAPFFMEDRRNVFYVMTEQQSVWIWDYMGYGIAANPGDVQKPNLPHLVLEESQQIPPKYWGDGGPIGPDPGIVDPAPMRRLITEDAYIRQGLATTRAVAYGDRQIGPSGSIVKVQIGG